MKNSNIIKMGLGALLLGALAGGAIGVLYAPRKGEKTRKKILSKRDDLNEFLKVRLHCVLEELKTKLEATTEKANQFLEIEKALNSKIIKLTLKIQEDSPELLTFMDEMSEGIASEDNPEVTLKNLKAYADSLEAMHKKYMNEHKAIQS